MFLIDSHCHLDKINLNNFKNGLKDILHNANSKNVKIILAVSTSLNNFKNIKKKFKNLKYNIYYSCGIHPLSIYKKKNLLN
ncbi:TatD family hydrolase [Buchnera aphidicola]|uniref:TatD family hydrolase n=1 Tax=Buchnera aphidicola TaxID=9 RepID=UPI0022371CCA|nr:TatD family hydrolase [Buchnera aphidicola]